MNVSGVRISSLKAGEHYRLADGSVHRIVALSGRGRNRSVRTLNVSRDELVAKYINALRFAQSVRETISDTELAGLRSASVRIELELSVRLVAGEQAASEAIRDFLAGQPSPVRLRNIADQNIRWD